MALFKKKKLSEKRKAFIKAKPKRNPIQNVYTQLIESFELLSKVNYRLSIKEFYYILLLLAFLGIAIGVLLKNYLLSLVFLISFPLLGVQYIVLKRKEVESYIERQVISYAELIKNSLLTSNSVLVSIKDITPRMQEPLKTLFNELISEVDIYNYSTGQALFRMNQKLQSASLKEITEQLILCDRDIRYITSFQTTTAFLNDKKEFMQLWDYRVRDISQKLFTLVLLLNILVSLSYFAFPDMVRTFLENPISKVIVSLFILIQVLVVFLVLDRIKNVQF